MQPITLLENDSVMHEAHVFMLVLARKADLQIKVTYEGDCRQLIDLIHYAQGDGVVRTLRGRVGYFFRSF